MLCLTCGAPIYSKQDALCDKCFAEIRKEIVENRTEKILDDYHAMKLILDNDRLSGGDE